MELSVKFDCEGWFKFEAFKRDSDMNEIPGSRRVLRDWFPNLILNGGLERMATNPDWLGNCKVGSGSTPPAESQTALVSQIATTSTISANTQGASGAPDYYTYRRNTYRFAEGAAAGNIAEVGVGWAAGLFSRALVVDSMGTPTTIQVLSDEVLDVTYEIRYYPKLTDGTGTVVFTGGIGGTYDYIFRAANVGITSGAGWQIGALGASQNQVHAGQLTAYDGDIGAVTGTPSGVSAAGATITALSYSASSYTVRATISAPLAAFNLSGGIRSIRYKQGIGVYQVQFDPAIPKTASDVLSLTFAISWGRRT